VEFSLVGASAMQVGTVNFVDPQIPLNIIDDLDKYLADNGINNLSDLKGTVDLSK
jgi:dihydroorotate dehydrogenase (NAD+) catalytic subunit